MKQESTQLLQIIKLMNLMVRDMRRDGHADPMDGRLISRLMKRGFRLDDIETAVRWLSSIAAEEGETMTSAIQDAGVQNSGAIRQLHASEAVRLTGRAQRLLLQMLDEGRVSPLHLERTIEYLWRNDLRQVGPERLEVLLYMNDPHPSDATAAPPPSQDKVPPPVQIH